MDVQFVKFPKAKLASFMSSFGVAAGKAMMTAIQRLNKLDKNGWGLHINMNERTEH